MRGIINFFAILGLIAVLFIIYLVKQFEADYVAFKNLDDGALTVYQNIWAGLKKSGNTAAATVWKVALEEGVSWQDAEQSMRFVANDHNIKNVGELPLSEQVAEMTDQDQRFLKIYQFCNPLTAMKMVNYEDAFSAYLPCRIAMIEDKAGKFWLYTLDMDMMIHGGKPLPQDLLEEAKKVKMIIRDIMAKGAAGDF